MTIGSITSAGSPAITTKITQKVETDSEKKGMLKSTEKNDSIVITDMAQKMKKASESSSSDNVVDVNKVAAIKKALADGKYQINAEKIAEKMIQHEKLMP